MALRVYGQFCRETINEETMADSSNSPEKTPLLEAGSTMSSCNFVQGMISGASTAKADENRTNLQQILGSSNTSSKIDRDLSTAAVSTFSSVLQPTETIIHSESKERQIQGKNATPCRPVEHDPTASVSDKPEKVQLNLTNALASDYVQPLQQATSPPASVQQSDEDPVVLDGKFMMEESNVSPQLTANDPQQIAQDTAIDDNVKDHEMAEASNQPPHTPAADASIVQDASSQLNVMATSTEDNDQAMSETSNPMKPAAATATTNDDNDHDMSETASNPIMPSPAAAATVATVDHSHTAEVQSSSGQLPQSRPKKKRRTAEDFDTPANQNVLANLDFLVGGTVEVSLDEIRPHFICSLCNGLYREPYTVNECLHTFCKSCLLFSFYRAKHKSCPECNITLGTDPARSAVFRSDGSLREIAKVLFPEVYKQDEDREREFYAKRGIALKPTYTEEEERKGHHQKPAATNATAKPDADDEVGLTLVPIRRGPKRLRLPSLVRPSLRTSGRIKIGQLKKYLVAKFSLSQEDPNASEIDILCNGVSLGNELSLTFVIRTMWLHANSDLELKYMLAKES